jgi:hypothetical protein
VVKNSLSIRETGATGSIQLSTGCRPRRGLQLEAVGGLDLEPVPLQTRDVPLDVLAEQAPGELSRR